MKAYICLAGVLTLISSLSLAGSDTPEASTPVSPVTSTTAPAVSASPGLVKTRAEVGAVLTRMMMSGDGRLSSLWSHSSAPQRPAGIAEP
jgi:hypothetical protein